MFDGLFRISGVEEGDKNKGGKEDRWYFFIYVGLFIECLLCVYV